MWLASVVVAIVEIVYARDLVLQLYAWVVSWFDPTRQQHDSAYWVGATLSNVLVLLLALIVVALAVGSGEYHTKHWGTRRSWRLFAWVLGIELVIFLLALFL